MKLEYDFDTHAGRIAFHAFDECLSDGEIIILLRTIDPGVKSIRITSEGKPGAMLVHYFDKWTAWRGPGPKRVFLPFGPPRSLEQLLELAGDDHG